VREQLPTLQAIATDNIDVVADSRNNGLVARFDPMLMQRVLINVVKNAVESIGDKKGSVTICVSDNMLQVVDNGAGISAEAAEKIFTPFFSTKHQDRGLGLMLIVDILRRHKASFTLCTDPVDKLTRFTIVFDK
jgi:signal transduction histidine kinase